MPTWAELSKDHQGEILLQEYVGYYWHCSCGQEPDKAFDTPKGATLSHTAHVKRELKVKNKTSYG